MSEKLSKEQFYAKIRNVEEATSVNGVHYSDICLSGNMITGVRDTTKKVFKVNADELYKAYSECTVLNTNILKGYISTRAQSPALAILQAAGLA